jgi:hypothetical protein
LRDPGLDVDWAEVVANQAADVDSAQVAAGAGDGAGGSGVRSGLDFKVRDWADLPFADFVDGGEVAVEGVAARHVEATSEGADRDAAGAGRAGC